jgi:YVTN family beta-propeller protein
VKIIGLAGQRWGFHGHSGRLDCASLKAAASRLGIALVVGLVALSGLAGCSSSTTVKSLPLLRLPPNLAAKLSGYHIYVSDLVTGDVAEIGVFTRHVSESVHGVGLSPDGKTLYVTDIRNNELDAFALDGPDSFISSVGPTHSVATGPTPVHMVSTGQVIFVTNFGQDSISVIDALTWKSIKTIRVCQSPHGIVLSPNRRLVYASCNGGEAVAVIDVASQTLLTTIPTPVLSAPYGIAVSADGRYVYVSDYDTGRLMVIDAAAKTYLRSVEVGAHPMLIAHSPDGKRLYVANNGSRSVSVLDIGKDPANPQILVAGIPVAGYPHGLALTPDGRYLLVANTLGDTLSVIDTSTNIDIGSIPGEKFPNDVVITT